MSKSNSLQVSLIKTKHDANPGIISGDLANWQNIVDIISETVDVPVSIIVKTDLITREILYSSVNEKNPFKKGEKDMLENHYCSRVISSGKEVNIPDTQDNRYNITDNCHEHGIQSYMGYPIFWPDGEIFGSISVMDFKAKDFDNRSINLVKSCKDLIESQLNLYNEYAHMEKRKNELEKLVNNSFNTVKTTTICSYCKKINSSSNNWEYIEDYLKRKFNMAFSHGICGDCSEDLFRILAI